jgi:hypothetical protein
MINAFVGGKYDLTSLLLCTYCVDVFNHVVPMKEAAQFMCVVKCSKM